MYDLLENIDESRIQKMQSILIEWGVENFIEFPWRGTENKLHALIAEVMLHKTRAEQEVPIYTTFTQRYPTIIDALEEDPENIRRLLKPLGLRWRAEKIIELIKVIYQNDCAIPNTREELLELPGVGQYAASAYSSFHLGVRAPTIDTNAVRLWSRVFGFKPNKGTYRAKWFINFVERITPSDGFKEFNYAVLDFTRTICKIKPRCEICPMINYCDYNKAHAR